MVTGAQQKVLLIDDDDDFTNAISMVLTRAGYNVSIACDGDVGIRAAAELLPDLILLDCMMPVKDGFCVCHELEQFSELQDVPVIMLTAFGQDIGEVHDLFKNVRSCNVQAYLEKPLEPNLLLAKVAAALAASGG